MKNKFIYVYYTPTFDTSQLHIFESNALKSPAFSKKNEDIPKYETCIQLLLRLISNTQIQN